MPADRSTTFLIGIDGDAGSIKDLVASVKSDLVKAVRDLQSASDKVKLFGDTEQQVKDAKDAFNVAQAAVAHFTDEVNKAKAAGGGVGDDLAKSLKDAQTAATAAEKAYSKSQTTLAKLDTQLTKAGVDTKNLATEQIRLSTALKQTAAQQDLANAKTALGFKTLADVSPQLELLAANYQKVRAAGNLTAAEQVALWGKYKEQIAQVEGQVAGVGGAFAAVRTPILAVGVAIATVAAVVKSFSEAFHTYSDGVVKLGTVSNVSKAQLDALGDGVRKLSTDLGFDLKQGLDAAFALLKSGVPADNVLATIAASADAAKAGFASLPEVVTLATTVVNAFGIKVADVPLTLDKIVVAAKESGIGFADLSGSLGEIAPIAKAAGVSFDTVLASLATLKKAGIDTPTAVAALTKVISSLADPDVAGRLRALGVNVTDLVGTLQSIQAKHLDLSQLKDIAPDARSLKAFAALVDNVDGLSGRLVSFTAAAGAAKGAANILDATQQEKVEKLSAAWDSLKISLGALVSSATPIITVLAGIANSTSGAIDRLGTLKGNATTLETLFPQFAAALLIADRAMDSFGASSTRAAAALPAVSAAVNQAITAASGTATQLGNTVAQMLGVIEGQINQVQGVAATARTNLNSLANDVAKTVTQLQAAGAAAIAANDAAAKAQIAALDAQNLSQAARAKATVQIEVAAAAQRLQIINDTATKVMAAFEIEAAARLKAVQGSSDQVKVVERELSAERQKLIGDVVTAYTNQVAQLTALQKGYLATAKGLDQELADFQAGLQNSIDATRAEGLGAYAVYQQKLTEIATTEERARAADAIGETDKAKALYTQALGQINGLGAAVTENGKEIVSSQEAQATKISLLQDLGTKYTGVLQEQKKAAVDGANATGEALAKAQGSLTALSTQYKALGEDVAKGLNVTLNVDKTALLNFTRDLDDALKQEHTLSNIKFDLTRANDQVKDLQTNIEGGFTEAAKAGADIIADAVKAAAEKAPELGLKTHDALASIADLQTKIQAIADEKKDVALTAKLDAKQATADYNELSKDRNSTLTVRVKAVGDVNALGDAGGTGGVEAGVPGLARGGPVPRRFARGGGVFTGRKVPGVGNRDTFGANLQGGSFVVRKSASEYYGDGLLGKLARGLTQTFATGGFAFPPAFQGLISSRLANGISFDIGSGSTDNADLDDLESKLQQIVDASTNLPSSHNLPDIRTWAAALMERLKILPAEKLAPIREAIDDNFQLMLDAINVSRQFRVPATVGPDLFAFLFGRGGDAPTTDTVPALLTPGEWVMNKTAVGKYGTNFMHALNNMVIPREALTRMLTPPRVHRFAEGGLVSGSAPVATSVAAVTERPNTTNNTFNVTGFGMADIFSEANLVRHFAPAWDRIQRRRSRS